MIQRGQGKRIAIEGRNILSSETDLGYVPARNHIIGRYHAEETSSSDKHSLLRFIQLSKAFCHLYRRIEVFKGESACWPLHAGDTLARYLRVFAGTFRLSSAAATNVLRKSVSSACLRRAISRKRGEIAHATFPR